MRRIIYGEIYVLPSGRRPAMCGRVATIARRETQRRTRERMAIANNGPVAMSCVVANSNDEQELALKR